MRRSRQEILELFQAGRLKAMQQAGIKWGRQDFTWKRIEKQKGEYDWDGYDRLVEQCRQHGLLLFGHEKRRHDGALESETLCLRSHQQHGKGTHLLRYLRNQT